MTFQRTLDPDSPTKFCAVCKETKSKEEFHNNRSTRDGKAYSCKICSRKSTRDWRIKDDSKAKIRASGLAWKKANPDMVKANKKRFRENNPESARSSVRKCWKENYDKYRVTGWRRWIKVKYGLTENQYYELLEKQDFGCAICGKSEADSRRKRFCVDHCHDTNIVRGLLCFGCNVALGNVNDRIDLLEKAIEYLKKFPKPEHEPVV